jgi:hypothetical protein
MPKSPLDRNQSGHFLPENRANITHLVCGFLELNSLPKGANYVRRILGEFKTTWTTASLRYEAKSHCMTPRPSSPPYATRAVFGCCGDGSEMKRS